MRVGRYLYCPRSTSSLSDERVISVLVLPSSTAHLMRSRNWVSIFLMRSARRRGTDTLRAARRFCSSADFLAASRSTTPLLIFRACLAVKVAFILVAPFLVGMSSRTAYHAMSGWWERFRRACVREHPCHHGGRGRFRGESTTMGHPMRCRDGWC